jgi:hypothetical protein
VRRTQYPHTSQIARDAIEDLGLADSDDERVPSIPRSGDVVEAVVS